MFHSDSYDRIYSTSNKYKQHYSKLRFYPVWKYIASKLHKRNSVVDLGCGCGHFAHLLYDRAFTNVKGYDFSPVAVAEAKKRVPFFEFWVADLMNIHYWDATYTACEVFEHIEDDKALIKLLPKESRLIFSVPNYKAPNHYRTYNGEIHIREYYKGLLTILSVQEFPQNSKDSIFVVDSIII